VESNNRNRRFHCRLTEEIMCSRCVTSRTRYLLLVATSLFAPGLQAGFLEMPELIEAPEVERKSMLRDLDIPNVRGRDPDPNAGPRLNVTKFKLQGVVEYPELGITRSDVEKLIETIRYDLMEEYRLLPSGFTEAEVKEVSTLLGEIENDSTGRPVNDLDLQKLVWLIRDQRSKRGVTLGQIEAVADRITQFYRERGFILAKAYIPEQAVRDGIVTLTLLLGTLGDVEIQGNRLYGTGRVVSVFDDMLGQPVTSDAIEEALYLINDHPGLSVVGYFEPGREVGDTNLQLNVHDERRYQGFARLDNHGSDQTGNYRLYAEARLNNLIGASDQLTVGALTSFYPDNTTYGQLKYSVSLFSPRFFVSAETSTNQFVLAASGNETLDLLDLSGVTDRTAVSMLYKIKRSRIASRSLVLTAAETTSRLESNNDMIDLDGMLDNKVESISLAYLFDTLNEAKRRLHQGAVSVLAGRDEEEQLGKAEEFFIAHGDYSLLSFWDTPFNASPMRFLLQTEWQYSDDSLPSINQFSLAGPTVAKGFPVNTFSADSGVYAGLQLSLERPALLDFEIGGVNMKDVVQPSIFLDMSYGVQKRVTRGSDVEGTLVDGGFGFQIALSRNAQGNLFFAFPIASYFSSSHLKEDLDGVRAIFDYQYMF